MENESIIYKTPPKALMILAGIVRILLILAVVIGICNLNSTLLTSGITDEPDYQVTPINGDTSTLDTLEMTNKVYSHTVIVYMVGSDLESESGMATEDINEMISANPDTVKNNILVYTGGSSKWNNDIIKADTNELYQINGGSINTVKTFGQSNMGDPNTLDTVLEYVLTNYETDKYDLILWDHGGGPMCGVGSDEHYDNDGLELPELKSALSKSTSNTGKKFETIGFDACLMCSLEVATSVKDFASYMIASQETEPGYGWNYKFLSKLSEPDMDGARMGKEVVDDFMAFYNDGVEAGTMDVADLTLSCIDLSKVDDVNNNIGTVMREADYKVSNGEYNSIARARQNTKAFAKFSATVPYDLVDLKNMMMNFDNADVNTNEFQEMLESMIVYTDSNVPNANGISIYCPYDGVDSSNSEYILDYYTTIDISEDYKKFVTDFVNTKCSPYTADKRIDSKSLSSSFNKSDTDFKLKLSDNQRDTFSSATYYILKKGEHKENAYVFVLSSVDTRLNGNVLTASFRNKAVFAKSDGKVGSMPIQLVEKEVVSNDSHRFTSSVVLQKELNFGDKDFDASSAVEAAELQIEIKNDENKANILSAVPLSNEGKPYAAKKLLDLNDYEIISFIGSERIAERDSNGNMKNFYAWKDTGWGIGSDAKIDKNFALEISDIKDPENYYCMFSITDIYGNISNSDLIPMKASK